MNTPGSPNSVTPRTRNSMASRVLPQPALPQTSVGRPRGNPPPVISSSPWMPVAAFGSERVFGLWFSVALLINSSAESSSQVMAAGIRLAMDPATVEDAAGRALVPSGLKWAPAWRRRHYPQLCESRMSLWGVEFVPGRREGCNTQDFSRISRRERDSSLSLSACLDPTFPAGCRVPICESNHQPAAIYRRGRRRFPILCFPPEEHHVHHHRPIGSLRD